jgi:hypothetical protein
MTDELTWTCHVCGDLRPDALISVRSRMVPLGTSKAQENIRYCNDRPTCVEGSKTKSFLGQVSKDLKDGQFLRTRALSAGGECQSGSAPALSRSHSPARSSPMWPSGFGSIKNM